MEYSVVRICQMPNYPNHWIVSLCNSYRLWDLLETENIRTRLNRLIDALLTSNIMYTAANPTFSYLKCDLPGVSLQKPVILMFGLIFALRSIDALVRMRLFKTVCTMYAFSRNEMNIKLLLLKRSLIATGKTFYSIRLWIWWNNSEYGNETKFSGMHTGTKRENLLLDQTVTRGTLAPQWNPRSGTVLCGFWSACSGYNHSCLLRSIILWNRLPQTAESQPTLNPFQNQLATNSN